MGQKLKLDFSGVETFQRASEGIHTVKIATAEVTKSQGGNDMITVSFEVTKGADKGARVYENFPIMEAALWKLKGLLTAVGMKADGKVQLDVDKLVGKVCQINVKHEEYDGKTRARCESIMKFSAGADEDVDDEEDEDLDEAEVAEEEEEPEEKPAKKDKKAKKEPMNKPEPADDEDDDDWDDDEDEAEEEEEKPKKSKATKKEEKPKKADKKPAKKSKKEEEPEEEDDDDWDDDDDDWDEE